MRCRRRVSSLSLFPCSQPALAQQTCPCPPRSPLRATGKAAPVSASPQPRDTDDDLNVTFDATYDPKQKDLWKLQGLYLRGETDGEVSVDRLFLQGRYERKITTRAFLFGQAQYLRDEFKEIDYLFATSGGVGYKVIASDTVSFSVDGGAGVSWEKNPGLDVDTSGVITGGDQFTWKLSPSATITQSASALWDADDFGDALYTFSAGLTTSVLKQIELKSSCSTPTRRSRRTISSRRTTSRS